jgi:hypothetical protein
MKKVILTASLVLFVIGLGACRQNKPEFVVERYYIHYYRNEYKEIQKYVMPEHRSYYELMGKMLSPLNDTAKKSKIKLKNIKCSIKGDTVAICSCSIEEDNKKHEGEQIIQLKKINNKWLVNQGKENGQFHDVNDKSEKNTYQGEPPPEENDLTTVSADENKTKEKK